MLAQARAQLTRERLVRAGLVLALCAGVAGATFGAGYRSSHAVLGDGSAYVQKGHTIVHVNAENRDPDALAAEELATGKQQLEVVQVSPDSVYVVNHDTGEVSRLPTDSMKPQQVDQRSDAKGKLHVVAGGGSTYLVDAKNGSLAQLDDRSGARKAQVTTPEKIDQVVVDGNGAAWALSKAAGVLYAVRGGEVRSTIRVAGVNDDAQLTLAGGRPMVFQPRAGIAGMYNEQGLVRRIDLPGEGTARVAAPGADATVLAIVYPRTGELAVVNFATGSVDRTRMPGRDGSRLGPPVVSHGRVYVPDYQRHHVVIVTLNPLRQSRFVAVDGDSFTFEVFTRDGRVWVNDPYAKTMLAFNADGQPTEIDKGTGNGIRPEDSPDAQSKPATAPLPRPEQRPVPGAAQPKPGGPGNQPAKLVNVPNVVGMDKTRACDALTRAGLDCALVARPDGNANTGEVLQTDPPAGSKLAEGRKVTVVYQGPAQVPNVVGMASDQACRALQNARLNCSQNVGGPPAPDPGKLNVVSSQQPAAGAPVSTGSNVTVTFPTTIAVPNLVGSVAGNACTTLQAYQLGCTLVDRGACTPLGQVADQSPAAGVGLAPNQPVTVGHCGSVGVPAITGADPNAACAALQAASLVCQPNGREASPQVNVVHAQSVAPGTVVPAGTPVGYAYASVGPVALLRYKAPGARRANFLTPGGGPPDPSWSSQSSLGSVYAAGEGGVDGLVPIYFQECVSTSCGEPGEWYYTQTAGPQPTPGWVQRGVAFMAFSQPVPGSRPLMALRGSGHPWVWAVQGSWEEQYFISNGWREQFAVCYIW